MIGALLFVAGLLCGIGICAIAIKDAARDGWRLPK